VRDEEPGALDRHGPVRSLPQQVARTVTRLLGRGAFGHQLRTHALNAAADASFTVSLAGSLFFSVPLNEARPKIILYLLLTVVPFAVVAPLVGPVVDRYRGGHRVVVAAVCAARALICVAMAGHLKTLFVFPEALAVLALGKVYSVAKNALVPGLVPDTDALVDANSRLSRVSAVAGAVGGAAGAGVAALAGAPWALLVAAAAFGGATLTATRLPPPVSTTPVTRALEYEELHAPAPILAAGAMAVLRMGTGFLGFLLAFELRQAGEPAWFFGLALAAAGVGNFLGTFAASQLRRLLHEEQMLALALVVPAVFILAAGVQVGRPSVLGAALALGVGSNVGRQAFDSLIQHKVPDANRSRLFARFETGFQLAWAAGALVPVVVRPSTWEGLLGLAAAFIAASIVYITSARTLLRFEAEAIRTREWVHRRLESTRPPVEAVMLLSAEEQAARGAHRIAVIEAAAACELMVERSLRRRRPLGDSAIGARPDLLGPVCWPNAQPEVRDAWDELRRLRMEAVCADEELTAHDSDHAIALAGSILESRAAVQVTAPVEG
jgi:Major Facilitator Superfamily